jgi:hypothetical protein
MIALASSTRHEDAAPGSVAGGARKQLWTGRVLSGLGALFLAFDGAVQVLALPFAVDATVQLGYPADVLPALGLVELVCLVVYLVPRTAPLGAVLWTGYLGGAVATHVRVGNPAFETVFPIVVAAVLWTGLALRDARVRALVA